MGLVEEVLAMKKFVIFFALLLLFTVILVGFQEFLRNVALALTIALFIRLADEVMD